MYIHICNYIDIYTYTPFDPQSIYPHIARKYSPNVMKRIEAPCQWAWPQKFHLGASQFWLSTARAAVEAAPSMGFSAWSSELCIYFFKDLGI